MATIDFGDNPSLNQIVSSLAARVNKQHDVAFMDELKHIVNYKRAAVLNIWMLKLNVKEFLYTTYFAETERVTGDDICTGFPSDCYMVRTVCKVPNPFRSTNMGMPHEMFDYVGHISGYQPYAYAQPEMYALNKYRPYTSETKKWYYSGGYIYIINDKSDPPDPIMFRGVFQDVMSQDGCNVCDESGNVCEKDSGPYPVPPELLDIIVTDILSKELKVGEMPTEQNEEKDTIKVDSQEKIMHQNL